MLCRKINKDLIELMHVVGPVVGRQGNARKQHTDVGRLDGREDGIEVAARLVQGQPA